MWTVCKCARRGVEYFRMIPQEIKDKFFLFETEKDLDIGMPFKFEGVCYSGACKMPKDKIIIVHEFSPAEDKVEEAYGERNITCPYCGDENVDSWEMGSDDGEEECQTCGSTFSWQREVSVTYNSQPVRLQEIVEIKK